MPSGSRIARSFRFLRKFPAALFPSAAFLVIAAVASIPFGTPRAQRSSHAASEPWTASQTILPAALARELAAPNSPDKPVVVCAGFHPLYHGAHIPGASYHGPASTPEGLADLKNWAAALPRSINLVVYCACCPLEHCPNIRPAFEALRGLGFSRLRVLLLPTDFNTDWIAKGFPVEKGS